MGCGPFAFLGSFVPLPMISLLALATVPVRILFLGNSHTGVNDFPSLVCSLLESGGLHCQKEVRLGGLLRDLADESSLDQIRTGKFDFVVLQGAEISSSHKYRYAQAGPIKLARTAATAGARPLLFAEWPRRGWDESDFILGVYREIQKAEKKAEIVPICRAWDLAGKRRPKLDLWSDDGNHADLAGSYLAAATMAYWIAGAEIVFTWGPTGLSAEDSRFYRGIAQESVKKARP